MTIRHPNRARSKVIPKAVQHGLTKPQLHHVSTRQNKRDRRVGDRRQAKLSRQVELNRELFANNLTSEVAA